MKFFLKYNRNRKKKKEKSSSYIVYPVYFLLLHYLALIKDKRKNIYISRAPDPNAYKPIPVN